MSCYNCCFLTWIQISQEAGQVVWYSHLFQNFPQSIVIHTVKGFGIVSKAEIDVFLELSCFFHDPADVGNLISCSSAFSKSSLNIREFTVHLLLKSGLENFEHYFTSMWDEYNFAVAWAFFGIAFLWDWNENWLFQSCGHFWVFQIWSSLYFICFENPLSFTPRVSVHNIWNKSCLSTLSTLQSRTYLREYEDNIIGGNRGILGHFHFDADILQIPAWILVQLWLLLVFYSDLCDLSSTRDGAGISEPIMDQVLSWALYKYYLF